MLFMAIGKSFNTSCQRKTFERKMGTEFFAIEKYDKKDEPYISKSVGIHSVIHTFDVSMCLTWNFPDAFFQKMQRLNDGFAHSILCFSCYKDFQTM